MSGSKTSSLSPAGMAGALAKSAAGIHLSSSSSEWAGSGRRSSQALYIWGEGAHWEPCRMPADMRQGGLSVQGVTLRHVHSSIRQCLSSRSGLKFSLMYRLSILLH